jgi:hypothetical protein
VSAHGVREEGKDAGRSRCARGWGIVQHGRRYNCSVGRVGPWGVGSGKGWEKRPLRSGAGPLWTAVARHRCSFTPPDPTTHPLTIVAHQPLRRVQEKRRLVSALHRASSRWSPDDSPSVTPTHDYIPVPQRCFVCYHEADDGARVRGLGGEAPFLFVGFSPEGQSLLGGTVGRPPPSDSPKPGGRGVPRPRTSLTARLTPTQCWSRSAVG